MGNIRSLQKAFEHLGQPVRVCDDPREIRSADAILLPGDGAYGQAMQEIRVRGFYEEIQKHHDLGKPIFGVCIGFQILFSGSDEFGEQQGLDFLPGHFSKIATELVLPHIGWSQTRLLKASLLTKEIPDNSYFYYVHSYALKKSSAESVGSCIYGEEFTSIIEKDNLFGVQFHPEKSQKMGLTLLKNFLSIF